MPRRYEIELTSRTGDGAYTWRVAGAKQPRGVVSEGLVPAGAAVGDVLRAELESGIDGLEVVNLQLRETQTSAAPNRIEVLGAPRRGPDVSVTYAPGARRRRDDGEHGERDDRPPRRDSRRPGTGGPGDRQRRPRPDGAEAAGAGANASEASARSERAPRGARPGGDRHRSDRPGGERPRAERPGGERPRAERPGGDRPRSDRHDGERQDGRAERRPARAEGSDGRPGVVRRDRDRKPAVSTTHRNAMLAALGPQELPIAEQLLRGGIPAVRQAIAEQNTSQVPGASPVNADAVLAIAEQLLPKVNLAKWKDQATSAQLAGRDLRLRELRAVVTASRTVSLDDEARAMSKALHESLDQRVQALRDEWLSKMTKALDDGKVTEALGHAARPPEPSTRLPAELAVRLAEAASGAMTAATDPVEWRTLLDAVVESPVRRSVKPQGIPANPGAHNAALHAAGSVPELAKLLGLRIPPPPPPPRRPGPPAGRVIAVGGAGRAAGH